MRKGYIYFITDGDAIKIGFAKNPAQRLIDLQISHYFELHLLASFAADFSMERRLHSQFKAIHIRGEWFHADKTITDHIAEWRETAVSVERAEHKQVLDLNRFAKSRRKNKERLRLQTMTQGNAMDSMISIS